jgi:protein arginine kinase
VNSLRDFWSKQYSRPEELPKSDPVVLWSDFYLSRNLLDLPFPERLSSAERREMSEKVAMGIRKIPAFRRSFSWDLGTLSEDERLALQEWGYISPLDAARYEGSCLWLKDDGLASVWTRGHSHLCWHASRAGLCLDVLWKSLSRWASALKDFDYAFSPDYGYLAADLEEWGSGLRASVVLYIPAIVENGLYDQTAVALRSLGLKWRAEYEYVALNLLPIVRIFHDDSSKSSPEEILCILKEAVLLVADREHSERNYLLQRQRSKIWDQVNRSWGTLLFCQLLSSSEALYYLFHLRLGVNFGWLPKEYASMIDVHVRRLLSASFRIYRGIEASQKDREDTDRARYVKEFIALGKGPSATIDHGL